MEKFPIHNDNNSHSEKTKRSKGERKYLEYLDSPLAAEITRREMLKKIEGGDNDFNLDDFQHGAMAIHDYKIELELSGDIVKDSDFLFRAANAEKLVERLENGESAVGLLAELKTAMQKIIDNSDQEGYKELLWKAIEVKINIEDILENDK